MVILAEVSFLTNPNKFVSDVPFVLRQSYKSNCG
jgi:hypothetical protein